MKDYYLGLDIGTDSVGYAAANPEYELLKFKGEPIWGVSTFEAASPSAERRAARVSRRRYDRRQQRVQLVSELFAEEICRIDPNFFIRRKESALFAEDTTFGVKIFDGGLTDREYYKQYPTIHHLILDLMTSDAPRDVRLVYLATAWLVANRGHFLFDVPVDHVAELMDFSVPYEKFRIWLQDMGIGMPWDEAVESDAIHGIMQMKTGSSRKQEAFRDRVYGGKAPGKKQDEYPFSRNEIVKLLCGAASKPKDLYFKEEYKEMKSVSLSMADEDFAAAVMELGEDGELLSMLRALYDCSMLISGVGAGKSVSAAKVEVYEQHKADLKYLKQFLRKYRPKEFNPMFRIPGKDNYVAYSYHVKSCTDPKSDIKKAKKQAFSDYLKKIVKNIQVEDADREQYEDMLNRLELQTFLPKQKNTDNRVIPMQLYHYELAEILRHASGYLPMLNRRDETGLTVEEKLLSVFTFRIPYFVGPLNPASSHAWLEREAGKIYPWNFEQKVNLDASEQAFIKRMTNECTYWPGKNVLPVNSLLYERFAVLNAINNLKISGNSIPVPIKQEIYNKLFVENNRAVSLAAIGKYLKTTGKIEDVSELSGLDVTYKGRLKSYHSFRRLMASGVLTAAQVENIINHAAYSEDRHRLDRWLQLEYPAVSESDRKYICGLNLKEFGRLSREFLTELVGADKSTGEAGTILEALWNTNDNLMQLLSERYTFRERLDELAEEYYASNNLTLSDRLDNLYVSNAVKRPIIRTLDITSDVVKAMGGAPKKIFVEMARGATEEQRGRRTQTRKQQLMDLYKAVKTEDSRRLAQELEAMGEMADNRLQSDKLYLYYLQMGRCMYTGEAIDLMSLFSDRYDIDHIYPRRFVKDDSILNNKVLVTSRINGIKGERYPIDASIRQAQAANWEKLHKAGLLTDEKYRRLTRASGFTEEEKYQFINRQLVETRQSTKAVAQLLKEKYPDTEIVYVKAGLVSEFRQEFDMVKCRAVNDLHHAKDAYLNIVVGNVYTERFTKKWFNIRQEYSLNTKPLYTHPVNCGGKTVWQGSSDLEKVRKIMAKNAIHLTRYSFCRKGSLFDLMPLKAGEGLIPRKKGLDTAKYGGYNKPAASFYLLASYEINRKKDILFVPVELMWAERVKNDPEFAQKYVTDTISQICRGKAVENVMILLNSRQIKINTVIEVDGMRMTLRGKTNKGANIVVASHCPLVLGVEMEKYVKHLESYAEKKKQNASIGLDERFDHISAITNGRLYELLLEKMEKTVFAKCPGNLGKELLSGRDRFAQLALEEQVKILLAVISWFGTAQSCDLTAIGGKGQCGTKRPSAKLSAYAKNFNCLYIIDQSASGLFESCSENLLELL